jgi:hypothetical protein
MWVWSLVAESSSGWLGAVVYFGGHVIIGAGFFYMGHKAKVPMYLNPDVPRSFDAP